MDLAQLRPVYEAQGPFATVYLEARSPVEDASTQIQLRWQGVRERLTGQGATSDTLDSLEQAILADSSGEAQANGRVLVATDAGVLLEAAWDAALGAGDEGYWTEFPELGSYVREWARSIRLLVVLADYQQAQLRREIVAEQHSPREMRASTTTGSAYADVHKPREGGLAHKHMQRRADEVLKQNAKDIAARISSEASAFGVRLIALGGDVKARTTIREHLGDDVAHLCVEIEHGSSSEEKLADELTTLASELRDRQSRTLEGQLREGLAHGRAVQGAEPVIQAAQMGALEVLLFQEGTSAEREAFLLKAGSETSSAVDVLPAGAELVDGVGGTLRFPLPS